MDERSMGPRVQKAIEKEQGRRHLWLCGSAGPTKEEKTTEFRLALLHAQRTEAWGGPDKPRAA